MTAQQPVALVTGASPSATTRPVDLTAGTIPTPKQSSPKALSDCEDARELQVEWPTAPRTRNHPPGAALGGLGEA